MTEIVRVLRVLEYVGPRRWIESACGDQCAVPINGQRSFGKGCTIRSAVIGNYPEVLDEGEKVEADTHA